MSTDVCVNSTKKKCSSSIFLKKAKLQQAKFENAPVSPASNTIKNNSRSQVSSSFSKLHSVGLTLLSSVSKRKTRNNDAVNPARTESERVNEVSNMRIVTQNNRTEETVPQAVKLKQPKKLEPSCSARPFSQFFYSILEEEVPGEGSDVDLLANESVAQQLTFSTKIEPSQKQKQQQTKYKPPQRHSIALDFISNQQRGAIPVNLSVDMNSLSPDTSMTPSISSTRNSSRSSSLQTIGSAYMAEEQALARNSDHSETGEYVIGKDDCYGEESDTVLPSLPTIQSDITFLTPTYDDGHTKPTAAATIIKQSQPGLSRSISQQIKEKRLSGVVNVSRARTAFGFDSAKTKESRAILVWRKTISQLLLDTLDEEDQHNDDVTALTTTNHIENNSKQELYEILSHPVFTPDYTLERQRFVRPSNTATTAKTTSKNLTMIKFILNEVLETERSYNQLLVLIRNKYMRPMIAASRLKDPLVKSSDIPVLFNHLPELIRLSDNLLHGLQTTNNIGQTFRSLESKLVVFLKYAMHYRTNTKTIRKACNNVLFVKIDRENLSRRDTNRWGMSDYLIAPIQRIPRYCLLIKDLQKYTPRTDPNYTELDLALKILTGLAVAMDYAQDNKLPAGTYRSINRTL